MRVQEYATVIIWDNPIEADAYYEDNLSLKAIWYLSPGGHWAIGDYDDLPKFEGADWLEMSAKDLAEAREDYEKEWARRS